MLRAFILLLLGVAIGFASWPFLATARARDARGIILKGRVYHKSETAKVNYSGWSVQREVTVEYPLPENGGVSYFDVQPDVQHYDSFHTGQPVDVKYLLRRDVPNLPMADALWQMHALPVVRLSADSTTGALPSTVMTAARLVAGFAVLIFLWRITKSRLIGWAVAIAVLAGVGWLFVQGFPRATPPPTVAVKHAVGRVKSIGHIDKLFDGQRSRGVETAQPVDVVGVEFVPEGRTEPVLAVDLIDRGSISGLKEKSTTAIGYETDSPRTAYLDGATRTFPARNLRGAVMQAAVYIGLLLAVWALVQWIKVKFQRLTTPTR